MDFAISFSRGHDTGILPNRIYPNFEDENFTDSQVITKSAPHKLLCTQPTTQFGGHNVVYLFALWV